MNQEAMEKFYFFVVDEERKAFTIHGPITDETAWNQEIGHLRQAGKNIRGFCSPLTGPAEELAAEFSRVTGLTYTTEPLLEMP